MKEGLFLRQVRPPTCVTRVRQGTNSLVRRPRPPTVERGLDFTDPGCSPQEPQECNLSTTKRDPNRHKLEDAQGPEECVYNLIVILRSIYYSMSLVSPQMGQ